MVAFGLLAVVTLTLLGLLASSLSLQDKGEENLVAVHLAEAEMQRWKSRSYREVVALVSSPLSPRDVVSGGREYRCQVLVSPDSLSLASLRLLRLKVRLDWTETTALTGDATKSSRPAFFELESIMAPGTTL